MPNGEIYFGEYVIGGVISGSPCCKFLQSSQQLTLGTDLSVPRAATLGRFHFMSGKTGRNRFKSSGWHFWVLDWVAALRVCPERCRLITFWDPPSCGEQKGSSCSKQAKPCGAQCRFCQHCKDIFFSTEFVFLSFSLPKNSQANWPLSGIFFFYKWLLFSHSFYFSYPLFGDYSLLFNLWKKNVYCVAGFWHLFLMLFLCVWKQKYSIELVF